ncbi:glyoxylase-like metal-dependent hydrolase (beta-lactamase superfamily II) [Metabacillus crassostreae]|uniref:MBL fold metallo-hydrolase n=1 Tax=Metabacillus crassostreae TaxID=929098 RepID=UPI00195E3EEC|nr:MBL fold metallo-hydrolase [Metabacillus crassostreae]MBM7603190.1 glyoxylase-like metal-dependent hydrolase (beta-lactamase superfamily II) [Metabacillus crassostreae]
MPINSLKIYECGYCTHPEKVVNPKKSLKTITFSATAALLKHPEKGYILFDTGYASYFFQETKKFPYSIYSKLTPVYFGEQQSLKNQLESDGISADEISTVILSHFHGDHTAGLKDFPKANILTFKEAYTNISGLTNLQALMKGCLLETLPKDIEKRIKYINDCDLIKLDHSYGPFYEGRDLFGDCSVIAIDLTGHAIGQCGLFVQLHSGKRVLLCADAIWVSEAYENAIFPHRIAHLLIEDVNSYKNNVLKLHELSKQAPEIDILPTHCKKTANLAKEGYIYE